MIVQGLPDPLPAPVDLFRLEYQLDCMYKLEANTMMNR